jgi:hypothetical protein
MEGNNTLLNAYYRHRKGDTYQGEACESVECRAQTLCTMNWFTSQIQYSSCVIMLKLKLESGDDGDVLHINMVLLAFVMSAGTVLFIVLLVLCSLRIYRRAPYSPLRDLTVENMEEGEGVQVEVTDISLQEGDRDTGENEVL